MSFINCTERLELSDVEHFNKFLSNCCKRLDKYQDKIQKKIQIHTAININLLNKT